MYDAGPFEEAKLPGTKILVSPEQGYFNLLLEEGERDQNVGVTWPGNDRGTVGEADLQGQWSTTIDTEHSYLVSVTLASILVRQLILVALLIYVV